MRRAEGLVRVRYGPYAPLPRTVAGLVGVGG